MRIALALLLIPALASAQVYKCVVNGKTQYAERPCAPDAKYLPATDVLTTQRQNEAADVARREKILSLQQEADSLREKAAQIRKSSIEKAEAIRANGRCASLQRIAKNAENESDLYYSQRFKDDAKRRQKEAESALFTECFGTVTTK